MTSLTQLKMNKASFRGVEFLYESSSIPFGRRSITHTFVNSDRIEHQDVGIIRDQYIINAVTTAERSLSDVLNNKDYYTWRDSFKRALSQPGPGILIHPMYGRVKVVVKNVVVNEDIRSIGLAMFSITFEESDASIFPVSSGDNAGTINNNANKSLLSTINNLKQKLQLIRMTKANILDAVGKGQAIGARFYAIYNKFTSNSDTASSFLNSIDYLDENTSKIVSNSELFGDSVSELFVNSNEYGDTAQERFDISEDIYDFGINDINSNLNTYELNQRKEVRTIINETMRTSALIQSYRNVPQIDFNDEDQINIISSKTESQFSEFEKFTSISDETYDLVRNLRVLVSDFYRQAQSAAFRIEEIQTETIPMSVLVYQYYGNLDFLDRIISLNPDQDLLFTSGTVRLLTR